MRVLPYREGHYDSALVEFNTASRLFPDRAEANENKGDLSAVLADYRVTLSLS